MNTPQMAAQASVLSNVNRQCQPIGPTDFESFTSALTFGAGASIDIHASTNGTLVPDTSDALFTHNVTFGAVPPPGAPGCFIVADDNPADTSALAGQVPAPTGTLRAAATAVPFFDLAKIEVYYSASGALPTNVNYTQLAQATAVPDDLKSALCFLGTCNGRWAIYRGTLKMSRRILYVFLQRPYIDGTCAS